MQHWLLPIWQVIFQAATSRGKYNTGNNYYFNFQEFMFQLRQNASEGNYMTIQDTLSIVPVEVIGIHKKNSQLLKVNEVFVEKRKECS